MISEELKEKITPYLIMELESHERKFIDDMFTEVYYSIENGEEVITLKPPVTCEPLPGQMKLALQFYKLNGAYRSVDDWESVKQRGKLM